MKVAFFSSQAYDQAYFQRSLGDFQHELTHSTDIQIEYFDTRLNEQSTQLCQGFVVVCVFVNDQLDARVLDTLFKNGVRHIALRCAGYNNLDLEHANKLGISVSRVPAYSPEAVAEHTLALILCLNRKLHKAYARVRENNFQLNGLLGFNLHGKTIGVVGTGKIGQAFIRCISGFGTKILCHDPYPNDDIMAAGHQYVDLNRLIAESDIISLHCPLTKDSHHLINPLTIDQMKPGVMLINTSRGALIDSKAVISGLKSQKIGYLGLDVYEMESELFFQDRSNEIIDDDIFERLATFPNVLITGHQGFFTQEALTQIANTTLANITTFIQGKQNLDTFLC